MDIKSYEAVYTRAYRLPDWYLASMPEPIIPEDHTFRNVFDSRYLEGKRIDLIDLDSERISFKETDVKIKVQFEVLFHRSGHAVAVATFQPESIPSLDQMKKIQNHGTEKVFVAFGKYGLGARDLCDIAILRLLSPHLAINKKLRCDSFEEQVLLAKSEPSLPDLLKKHSVIKSGFFTPTVFGCISLFGTSEEPTCQAIGNSGCSKLQADAELERELICHSGRSSVLIRRGSALVFSQDISTHGQIAVLQMAMLNFARHFNNYLCGELNQMNDMLKRRRHRAGKVLEKTKQLHEQVAYVYDELHDLSLWNRDDLVFISKETRAGSHWKLNEEVDGGLKKLDGMATLTSEICKVQARQNKHLISFTLAAIGVINLLQLIPIWNDYISKKLEFWVPTLTLLALVAGTVTILSQRHE